MQSDIAKTYLYDAEGRICAEASTPVPGFTAMTGYVYDAEGNRVAKGTITSWSCNLATNGFATAGNETDYVLGPGGEQVTELAQDANGSMNWQRTYVYAGSALIATYDPAPDSPNQPQPSFRLTDWLGTMRVTTDASGVAQSACTSLPSGDGQGCSGNVPDPRYFTGKERDAESGNDYFGARYFSSSMGRWLSPDWSAKAEPVPYATMSNPQSLNLYAYVGNNPLTKTDPTGHWGGWDALDTGDPAYAGWWKNAQAGIEQLLTKVAQQQNTSSSGGGFWSGLKHGFSNLLHGHSWNYVKTSVSAFMAKTWDAKDPNVTVVTDIAGLAGLVSKTVARVTSLPSAAASSYNDPSSTAINVLELVPGFEGLAIPQATVDYMELVQPTHFKEPGFGPWNFKIPSGEQPSYNPFDDGPENHICQNLGVDGC